MSLAEALIASRKAQGLTQEELASAVGVSQAALSRYEQGTREPDEDVLPRLAEALGVTQRFLLTAGYYRGAMAVDAHMRRRSTARASVWRHLEARLNKYRMHSFLLFEQVSLQATNQIPTFDPVDTPPATAARLVRMQWRMPVGPVTNLVQWLESAGMLVIEEDFGTSRVDGLSQWIEDHPIILLNQRMPIDRKRLTVAHEAAHLALHCSYVNENMEDEANDFAAEFLMPREVIRPQLRKVTLGRLQDLKREWGVSMQALTERAWHLGTITREQRTNLYKLLSHYGWRTREPVSDELPPEQPMLGRRIGDHLASKGLPAGEIAQLAGFRETHLDHPFRPTVKARPGLTVVR
jgi:Zn-dependent peptidase ImmA (M78 family)